MRATVAQKDLDGILHANHEAPFSILGMHRVDGGGERGLVVRMFLPGAKTVAVVRQGDGRDRYSAECIHEEGFFEASIPGIQEFFAYELEMEDGRGRISRQRDPYSFWPVLNVHDQYLFNEGTHVRAYEILGAHTRELGGVKGVHFAVWAPGARRVSAVGDFNHWDGRRHSMRSLGSWGIWEIFVPHIGGGVVYKYEIKTAPGRILLKSDPYGFCTEVPPRTGSIVQDIGGFAWSDDAWMARRIRVNWLEEPMAIYEVHAGSWRHDPEENRLLNYRELAHQLVAYVQEMGFTHIEFCRLLNTLSPVPGGIRWPATLRRRRVSAPPETLPISWITATSTTSA